MTTDTFTVAAPPTLTLQTRVVFKTAALDCLAREVEPADGALTIDMSETRDVDACGLGILVMVSKRARERGLATRLLHTHDDVRSLLQTTRLEPLFQFRGE